MFNSADRKEDNSEGKAEKHISSLILLPTRELAIQVVSVIKKILSHCKDQKKYRFKSCLISGGFYVEKQERLLNKYPDILIATIGRLWDLIEKREADSLETLPRIPFLIIDEIDRILDLGQFKELENILKFIENPSSIGLGYIPMAKVVPLGTNLTIDQYDEAFKAQIDEMESLQQSKAIKTNSKRRTVVVSATLGKTYWTSRMMNKKVKKKFKKMMKENPEVTPNMKLNEIMQKIKFKNKTKIIDMTQDTILPESLELLKIDCLKEEKMLYMYYFVKTHENDSIIIFTNSISSSKRIKSLFDIAQINSASLHSEMQQPVRIKKLDQFRKQKFRVLISTDVASRGLDIDNVNLVIHFHTPKDIDTMVHRCGRTARLGREGKSIILADANDRQRLLKYSRDLDKNRIKNIVVPLEKVDPLREIVNSAACIEKEEYRQNLKMKDKSWAKKLAEKAGIYLSEEEEESKQEDIMKSQEIRQKKNQLKRKLKNKKFEKFQQHKRNIFLSPADIMSLNFRLKSEATSKGRRRNRRKKPIILYGFPHENLSKRIPDKTQQSKRKYKRKK